MTSQPVRCSWCPKRGRQKSPKMAGFRGFAGSPHLTESKPPPGKTYVDDILVFRDGNLGALAVPGLRTALKGCPIDGAVIGPRRRVEAKLGGYRIRIVARKVLGRDQRLHLGKRRRLHPFHRSVDAIDKGLHHGLVLLDCASSA